jgi:hypothetical protein
MKCLYAITAILIAACTPAFAGDDNHGQQPGNASATAAATATAGSSSATSGGSSANVESRRSAFAMAPGLAVGGNDVCMGSTSAGVGAAGFSISGGSTWHDETCERMKLSDRLYNLGYVRASIAMVCSDKRVAEAMAAAGTPCAAAMTHNETPVAPVASIAAAPAPVIGQEYCEEVGRSYNCVMKSKR